MRAILVRNVPQARVIPGNAERIPLDDCSVDAVFVAGALHWFDSHAAGREVARVLRPGGTLLVCFNEWSGDFGPRLPSEGSTSSIRSLPADERLALKERLVRLLPDVAYRLPIEACVYRTRIGA